MTDRQLGTSIIYLYKMFFFNFAQCVYTLADIDMYKSISHSIKMWKGISCMNFWWNKINWFSLLLLVLLLLFCVTVFYLLMKIFDVSMYGIWFNMFAFRFAIMCFSQCVSMSFSHCTHVHTSCHINLQISIAFFLMDIHIFCSNI